MKQIPVRHIASPHDTAISGRFNIRDVANLLGGKDLRQDLHRHDFYFVLALQKGKGKHEIDFKEYDIQDNAIFILRPGQVHHLQLKAGSTGSHSRNLSFGLDASRFLAGRYVKETGKGKNISYLSIKASYKF